MDSVWSGLTFDALNKYLAFFLILVFINFIFLHVYEFYNVLVVFKKEMFFLFFFGFLFHNADDFLWHLFWCSCIVFLIFECYG